MRPQGRRGEILADPLTRLPGILVPGRELSFAAAGAASPVPGHPSYRIEEAWFPTGRNAARIVLKLSGCDSISEAEALAGADLLIPAGDLPALEPGAFFVADLLSCDLYDGTTLVGRIVDVQFPTSPDGRTRLEDAAPLLAVEIPAQQLDTADPTEPAPHSEPVLVPFVRAWLDSVDIPAHRIVMHLPLGLLDHNEEAPGREQE